MSYYLKLIKLMIDDPKFREALEHEISDLLYVYVNQHGIKYCFFEAAKEIFYFLKSFNHDQLLDFFDTNEDSSFDSEPIMLSFFSAAVLYGEKIVIHKISELLGTDVDKLKFTIECLYEENADEYNGANSIGFNEFKKRYLDEIVKD